MLEPLTSVLTGRRGVAAGLSGWLGGIALLAVVSLLVAPGGPLGSRLPWLDAPEESIAEPPSVAFVETPMQPRAALPAAPASSDATSAPPAAPIPPALMEVSIAPAAPVAPATAVEVAATVDATIDVPLPTPSVEADLGTQVDGLLDVEAATETGVDAPAPAVEASTSAEVDLATDMARLVVQTEVTTQDESTPDDAGVDATLDSHATVEPVADAIASLETDVGLQAPTVSASSAADADVETDLTEVDAHVQADAQVEGPSAHIESEATAGEAGAMLDAEVRLAEESAPVLDAEADPAVDGLVGV